MTLPHQTQPFVNQNVRKECFGEVTKHELDISKLLRIAQKKQRDIALVPLPPARNRVKKIFTAPAGIEVMYVGALVSMALTLRKSRHAGDGNIDCFAAGLGSMQCMLP